MSADDLSSDSSFSESDQEISESDLSLLQVNEMVREYEKEQKKERKTRWDKGIAKQDRSKAPPPPPMSPSCSRFS